MPYSQQVVRFFKQLKKLQKGDDTNHLTLCFTLTMSCPGFTQGSSHTTAWDIINTRCKRVSAMQGNNQLNRFAVLKKILSAEVRNWQ